MLFLLVFSPFWGGILYAIISSHMESLEREAIRKIIDDCNGALKICRGTSNKGEIKDFKIKGDILIWRNSPKILEIIKKRDGKIKKSKKILYRDIESYIPREVRANKKSNLVTLFFIVRSRLDKVGVYDISKEPAYRQYVDIAVVYWPSKEPVGLYSVISHEPPHSRPVKYEPEYGRIGPPVARWIIDVMGYPVIQILQKAISTISGLNDSHFKQKRLQDKLSNDVNSILKMEDKKRYQKALIQLENVFLTKMDGCAETGFPDKNDWIVDCDAQNQVYPLILDAIDLIRHWKLGE